MFVWFVCMRSVTHISENLQFTYRKGLTNSCAIRSSISKKSNQQKVFGIIGMQIIQY